VRSECSRSGVSHANRGVGRVGDRPCPSASMTAENMASRRVYRRNHPHVESPESKKRSNRKYRISSYGLTQEQFDQLLEAQNHACAMCHKPFAEGQLIQVDHDHACCPEKNRSCGKCVRGLLCPGCNISLGHIERRYSMARAYLDSPRGWQIIARQPESERGSSCAGEQGQDRGPDPARRPDEVGQFEVFVTQWHKSGRR
jgi:hypothetical protein